ncbi:MAG: phosphatidylserine decarboxylase family protein [Vicinamibacteria bacterium]
MSIARDGWPFIGSLAALALVLALLRLPWPAGVSVALALFCAFFFRDPERVAPANPALVVSPADGKVVVVAPAPAANPLGPGAQQISIFLSIFDVHVNRSPVAGTIEKVDYHKGEFLPAFDDKASLRNEQNSVVVAGAKGRVAFKQIAGLIARRIVFRKKPGDVVERAERVGLIRFGSRVDVFLAPEARLLVRVGDRVSAGSSPLAEIE